MFKEHPKGLPVLFFTEMWERFGYYLMLGIFVLYMIDDKAKGLGYSNFQAADVYGTYIALVYLTPFLGGLLADRVLGYINAIFIGGILMALGYFGLSIHSEATLWPSLLLIIVGNGFFKPNISTLVGNLYSNDKYRQLKDSGFNIFYMGINIGAFVCNFVAAYLRNEYGWGYAFAGAGIGMLIGVVWMFFGLKNIKEADIRKPVRDTDQKLSSILFWVFVPGAIAFAAGWFIPMMLFGSPLFGSPSTDAFVFASIPVVTFYFLLFKRADKDEKEPIAALLSIFGVVIIFWAIFHQNGAALTIWAKDYTSRELPATVESVANVFSLTEEVYKDNLKVTIDKKVTYVPVPLIDQSKSTDSSIYYKTMSTAKQYIKIDTAGAIVEKNVMNPYFTKFTAAELATLSDTKPVKLLSTEIFQSINPFFVVILTPVLVGFFGMLRIRGKEPSTAAKIGWGLFITALSTIVMMFAVIAGGNGEVHASSMWLVGTYFVVTIGELCLSPMGLSLVSKLSPSRITSLMMGGWFLSTSLGNKLSGVLSGLWEVYDNKVFFFVTNFILAFIAAAAIFAMVKWLTRVIKEHSS
ncbi:MAG: peptide MFS transporter [Ignavibacteriaceae bacterium]|nr:peptide MFS transporter [Ignavibacteriaceae bacterium]